MNRLSRTAALVAAFAMFDAAADTPYMGTWKLNVAESDLAGGTTTIAETSSGEFRLTDETGQSYTFKMDGREYVDPYGVKSAWKQIDASTWETTNRVNGKVASVDSATVSGDGKRLTIRSTGTQTSGKTVDMTISFDRVGNGSGLTGTWKNSSLKIEPYLFTLKPTADGAFDFTMADMFICHGCRFDGKPYPVTGTQTAAGTIAIFKTSGPRSFQMTWQLAGKTVFDVTFTVSEDGQTLTEVGGTTAVPRTWVFERQ